MANVSWKIARARGYAQLPLGIVGVLAVVLVLVGKAEPALLDRARARIADFMAPGLEAARAPLTGTTRFVGSVGDFFTVYQENLKLKEENARLRQWENAAVLLQERLRRYQLLLHAVPDPELSSVMAQVIGRSARPFQRTMIIDAGKTDGVKPGQAVLDAHGMIGRIFIAGEHTAWVILLTDLNSRIPVTIEPGNIQAIMAGDNSGMPGIEVVSQNVQPKLGSQVASSGDGSLLPPGLAIGSITGRPGRFRVSLLADAGSSQDVDVLDYKRPIESMPTPTPSDLPAVQAGLKPAPSAPVSTPVTPLPQTAVTAPAAAVPAPVKKPKIARTAAIKPATAAPAATAPSADSAPSQTGEQAPPPPSASPGTPDTSDDQGNNQ